MESITGDGDLMAAECECRDPDADRALEEMIRGMDTRQVVEYVSILTAGLHKAKSSASIAQLRLELATAALEKAARSINPQVVQDGVVKALSEMKLTLQGLGWCRKLEANQG